jgi:hypothetical protein
MADAAPVPPTLPTPANTPVVDFAPATTNSALVWDSVNKTWVTPSTKAKKLDEDWHTLLALAGLIAVLIIGLLQHEITVIGVVSILAPILGGTAIYASSQK